MPPEINSNFLEEVQFLLMSISSIISDFLVKVMIPPLARPTELNLVAGLKNH